MTLEEAIMYCKENACGDCPSAQNNRQLAEWLTELKNYREKQKVEIFSSLRRSGS